MDNHLKGCVQAAVLCVDSRKGDILAITGGRSALDGVDRWQAKIMPGELFTPVVNLCAVDQRRTVIRSNPEVTGRGVGFNTVIETAGKAGYKGGFAAFPGSVCREVSHVPGGCRQRAVHDRQRRTQRAAFRSSPGGNNQKT